MSESNYICTRNGIRFDLSRPSADLVNFTDIAVALENLPRFTGHVNHSVVAHSLAVYELVLRLAPGIQGVGSLTELYLAALLHDAHEAYMGDIATPVAQEIYQRSRSGLGSPAAARVPNGLVELKEAVQRVIHEAAELPYPLPYGQRDIIKAADNAAMLGERDLSLKCPERGWGPDWPTESLDIPLPRVIFSSWPSMAFLSIFRQLQRQRGVDIHPTAGA